MTTTNQELFSLLLHANTPLTSSELAGRLGISSRTVKREVQKLAPELQAHGARLASGNSGYRLEVLDSGAFSNYALGTDGHGPDSEDFLAREVFSVLSTREYATQDDLADILYVSRSTVGKLIKRTRAALEKNQVVLSSRPHYGYYLIGQEEAIRNAMVSWLLRDQDMESFSNRWLLDRCNSYSEMTRLLRRQLQSAGYEPSDPRINGLVKYFVVCGCRCAHGQSIEECGSEALVEPRTRSLAHGVSQVIARHFGTHLSNAEELYLSLLLGNFSTEGSKKEKDLADPLFFEQVVDKCISEVQDTYGIDFSNDETLRRGLVSHLYSTCSRMQINAVLDFPMLSMVKSQYAEAYDCAVLCGRILLDSYGLQSNEDSLGYIAMHFAAAMERANAHDIYRVLIVCATGFAGSELLRTRVISQVANVSVVAVISAYDLKGYDLSGISLILSTVELNPAPAKPCVHITQFFDDADAMAVSDYLRYFRDIEHIKALFSPTLFFPHVFVSDKDRALDLVCKRLIDAQVMEPKDRESIFRREEISSTEINPLVAMPHCILDSGDATKIAVFTTTSAVDWQYMDVQLIFVLLISRKVGLFKRTFTTIYRLTQDRDKVARLVETDDFGDFLEELFRLPSNAKPLRFNR
jgi:lichenan operon transcriptional antiterminator